MGTIVGVYIARGSRHGPSAARPLRNHRAALAGALWAAIAGIPESTVGAHEVITTIMLNWIEYWGGSYLFGRDGRCRTLQQGGPISDDIVDNDETCRHCGQPASPGAACRQSSSQSVG